MHVVLKKHCQTLYHFGTENNLKFILYAVGPVGFLRLFGLKTGIHFAHFGLGSGMVFEGTTECINAFIVSIPNEKKKEKYANYKWS